MDARSATKPAIAAEEAQRGFLKSPINRRRWANFRANKRGYWSLWIFLVLFFVTLFAEFIANDKPFLVKYDGGYYMPIFKVYPETTFGGDFATEADYRDPFVVDLVKEKGGWMLWPPIRYSYDTINLDLPVPAPAPPTWSMDLPDEDALLALRERLHTAGSEVTTARRLAIARTPRASTSDSTAGSPSGTAATASETPSRSIVSRSAALWTPLTQAKVSTTTAAIAVNRTAAPAF